jgi:membrane protein YqaA with SNARE-associated domain
MKSLFIKISGALVTLQGALISFGSLGVFLVSLLDAALIPLPGGADVVVMSLSHHTPALMPLYLLMAVVGSTIGSVAPYLIGRASGEAALRKFNAERRERVLRMLKRYDVWSLVLAAVLPPPFPFKIFVISAGVFRMQIWRFIFALVIGRGFRFMLEGLAAVYYGDQAAQLFKQHYPKIGLGIAVVIGAMFLLNKLLRRHRGQRSAHFYPSTARTISPTAAPIESEEVRPGDSMPMV